MTPAARWAAAIEILDRVAEGQAVEQALTTWGRRARYGGSKDRAAVRDIVFDITRRRRSAAWAGGGETGRALALGALRLDGDDPDQVFTGAQYAPEALSEGERTAGNDIATAPRATRLDLQDWVLGPLDRALGETADAVAEALRHRAPVTLRANLARATRDEVMTALATAGYGVAPVELSATAIRLTDRVRGLQTTAPFEAGLFEMQDAASQAVVDRLGDDLSGLDVLDYCAGGGGKALALAARGARVTAHDADPDRMRDLPVRAARAGVSVAITRAVEGRFDLVLCDAPCSGSGAWRRQPEGKWRLTEARLAELTRIQDDILDTASGLVSEKGRLAYATCSLFRDENEERVAAFLERQDGRWRQSDELRLSPLDGGDGFYLAVLERQR